MLNQHKSQLLNGMLDYIHNNKTSIIIFKLYKKYNFDLCKIINHYIVIYFANSWLLTFSLFYLFYFCVVHGLHNILLFVELPYPAVYTVLLVLSKLSVVNGRFTSKLIVCIDKAEIWSPVSGINDLKNVFLFSFINDYLVCSDYFNFEAVIFLPFYNIFIPPFKFKKGIAEYCL